MGTSSPILSARPRYPIAVLMVAGCIVAPPPLDSQEPTKANSAYHALTPMLEFMVLPFTLPGASLQVSTIRGTLEAPTISAGFFLTGGEGVWVNLGIGANTTVAGSRYVGAGISALFAGSFRPGIAPHVRLGAHSVESGMLGEVRVGLLEAGPVLSVILALRL